MARDVPEIDRLIEEGLTLYGQGDLERALIKWENALEIDPDNAQANSYVEYVRANYELLTSDGEATTEGPPFAIAEDDAEYQIEIQPGEIKPADAEPAPPLFMDPLDEGWFIDDETRDSKAYGGPPPIALDSRPSQELTMELDADEPPPRDPKSQVGMEFDDATREYQKEKHPTPPSGAASDDFGPDGTPAFGHPSDYQTPSGFGTQTTGIKQRDLGFVQPSRGKPMSSTDLGLPGRPRAPAAAPAHRLDELELDSPLEPFDSSKNRSHRPDDAATTERPPLQAAELDDLDLISSLPSPRPAPQVPQVAIDTPLSGATKNTTRELPHETRAPATPAAKTRELTAADMIPSIGAALTQDFDAETMARKRWPDVSTLNQASQSQPDSPMVSAPTRDLGLREANARADTATSSRGEGTKADVMLAFDPIDARATEIIEDIDETAPAKEAPEDKTRRRITSLFEAAAQWSRDGDLERAVAAVDLALSEDPNSALAQKLIHRNRETMMMVFQAYLGSPQRTLQLARPLHELASAPISPRAAFLLSRIDGQLTVDEILDVCGMPRLEAYRYLCQLCLRGILR